MKRLLPLAILFAFAWNIQAQYYYISHINAGQNPSALNTDGEYPVGGGLPAGWTTLMATSPTPTWTADQTIPFSFNFNGTAVTKFKASRRAFSNFNFGSLFKTSSTK